MPVDKKSVCDSFFDTLRNKEVLCSTGIIVTANDEKRAFLAPRIYLKLDTIQELIHIMGREENTTTNLFSIPMKYIKGVKEIRIGGSTDHNYYMSVHLSEIFYYEVPISKLHFYGKKSELYESFLARINAYIKRRAQGTFLNTTVFSEPLDASTVSKLGFIDNSPTSTASTAGKSNRKKNTTTLCTSKTKYLNGTFKETNTSLQNHTNSNNNRRVLDFGWEMSLPNKEESSSTYIEPCPLETTYNDSYIASSTNLPENVACIDETPKNNDSIVLINNTGPNCNIEQNSPTEDREISYPPVSQAYNMTLADVFNEDVDNDHDESFDYRRYSIFRAEEATNSTQDTHNERLGLRRSKRNRVSVYPDLNFSSPEEKPKPKRRKRNKNYRTNITI